MSYAETVFKYAVEFYTFSCEMLTNVTGVSYTVQGRPRISNTYPELDRFHIEYAVRYVALLQQSTPLILPTSIHDMEAIDHLYDMIHRIIRKPTFELTIDAEVYLSRLTQIRDRMEPGSIRTCDIMKVVQLIYECAATTCNTHLGAGKTYSLDAYHFDQAATLMRPRVSDYTQFLVAWSEAVDYASRQSVPKYAEAMTEIDALPTFESRTQEAIKCYAAYIQT